jgi:predicted acetyltransferase
MAASQSSALHPSLIYILFVITLTYEIHHSKLTHPNYLVPPFLIWDIQCMKLLAATMEPPPGLVDLLTDLGDGENGFMGTLYAKGQVSLEGYLRQCCDGPDATKLKPGFVPQTTFWLLDDEGVAVGMVRVRHYLNDRLLIRGGNIGYFIRRDQRGKGYGREALRLALVEFRKLGASRALITVHPDNIASIHVVEANGGQLENEIVDPETGLHHKRFWIDLWCFRVCGGIFY